MPAPAQCGHSKDGMPPARGPLSSKENSMRGETMRLEPGGRRGGGELPRNVFGGRLEECSNKPLTGFFRDGCCNTSVEDVGSHTVCTVMTEEFLKFSKARGNDLSTPMPEFGFPGLKA